MKKTLIALAAVAAATGALAQNVTLSGSYNVGYQKDLTTTYGNATANSNMQQLGGSTTGVSQTAAGFIREGKGFTVMDANLRISGSEDLGGGLRAAFDYTIESGNFRGAAFTRADSGASLSGGFGTVAFRNTRSGDLIAGIVSPAIFLPDGLYDSTGIVSRSAIDTFAYTSPELIKGMRASFTYVELNDGAISLPTSSSGVAANQSIYVLGATYANGPLSVAFAYKSKPKDNTASGGLTSKANSELSVAYDFGVARVAYAFDGAQATGTTTTASSAGAFSSTAIAASVNQPLTSNAQGISITVPVGAITLGAQTFKRGNAKVTDFGATYALSKRTSITAATGKKSGLTKEAGFNGTQYRVALRHNF